MELLAKMLSTTTNNTKAVAKSTRLSSRSSTLTITKLSTSSNLSRTLSGHCLDILDIV
jgi:hypothetical protein